MGKGTQRANYRKRSTWNEGNDVDKRCSIGLGFLNVNGWDDTSKDDVENAILSKSLEIFSLVETKKKPPLQSYQDKWLQGIRSEAKWRS